MNKENAAKLDAYLKDLFKNPEIQVKTRPKQSDSCEFYLGGEFLGVIYEDEEEGQVSYNLSMAILDIDLK